MSQFVADKVGYAISEGLKVIVCIGETLEQRESGATMDVLFAQIKAVAGNYSSFWKFSSGFQLMTPMLIQIKWASGAMLFSPTSRFGPLERAKLQHQLKPNKSD